MSQNNFSGQGGSSNSNPSAVQVYGAKGTNDVRSNMKKTQNSSNSKDNINYANTVENTSSNIGSSLPVIGKSSHLQQPNLP